jgi:hypothetical protein
VSRTGAERAAPRAARARSTRSGRRRGSPPTGHQPRAQRLPRLQPAMGLTELERDRERRIAENRRRMEAMLGDMTQYELLT